MDLSPRIAARIARDYLDAQGTRARGLLAALHEKGDDREGYERVCGAVLILADGDFDRLTHAVADAKADWRDVLMWSGLGNEDWREQLDDVFGPEP